MSKTTARSKTPAIVTPSANSKGPANAFTGAALMMSWELVVVMLVPIIGGVQIDHAAGSKHLFTFIGLALAILGSGVVIWRTVQIVNRFPVPKLTDAERRKVQKLYEDEDKESDQ